MPWLMSFAKSFLDDFVPACVPVPAPEYRIHERQRLGAAVASPGAYRTPRGARAISGSGRSRAVIGLLFGHGRARGTGTKSQS